MTENERRIWEIRQRLNRRSQSKPWRTYKHGSHGYDTWVIEGPEISVPFSNKDDADFIVGAPDDIAFLLDLVNKLRYK